MRPILANRLKYSCCLDECLVGWTVGGCEYVAVVVAAAKRKR